MKNKNLDERILSTYNLFMAHVEKKGHPITADDRVSEPVAAELIGYSPGHLKNIRLLGASPSFYNLGVAGSRVSYKVIDLAEWVEIYREDHVTPCNAT